MWCGGLCIFESCPIVRPLVSLVVRVRVRKRVRGRECLYVCMRRSHARPLPSGAIFSVLSSKALSKPPPPWQQPHPTRWGKKKRHWSVTVMAIPLPYTTPAGFVLASRKAELGLVSDGVRAFVLLPLFLVPAASHSPPRRKTDTYRQPLPTPHSPLPIPPSTHSPLAARSPFRPAS